jgi:hypothetical protein
MTLKDDLDKIKLLDSLFYAFTLDEMKELVGCDLVVSKLRGTADKIGPIEAIHNDVIRLTSQNATLMTDIMNIRSDTMMLKNDFQSLLRCLNKGMGDSASTSEFYNLKSRHGVY